MTESDGFEVVREPLLDEEVWLGETSTGLRVRVMPTDRFAEALSCIRQPSLVVEHEAQGDERVSGSPVSGSERGSSQVDRHCLCGELSRLRKHRD